MWIRMLLLIALALGAAVAYGADEYGATPASASIAASAADATNKDNQKLTCRERWKIFRKSQACFARYRLANGGVRAEAYKHCTSVKQPDFCE